MNDQPFPILYVDDEPANLRVFEATFRFEFPIFTAESGEEGLKILEREPIVIVITDQRMPGMTGVEFLSHVVAKYPNTIRFLLTGFSDLDAIRDAINIGHIYQYIHKPWDEQDLLQIIRQGMAFFRVRAERDQMIEDLQLSQTTLETSRDGVFWVTGEGMIFRINWAAVDILAYSREQLTRMKVVDLIPEHEREQWAIYRDTILEKGALGLETHFMKADGDEIPVEMKVQAVNFQDKTHYCVYFWDISNRLKRRKRTISAILEAEDRERARISQELHDSLGQKMTSTVLHMDALRKQLGPLDESAKEKYMSLIRMLNDSIVELRSISHNLMPKAISDFGYVLSVESMIEELSGPNHPAINFYSNLGDKRLPANAELGLFRITQEALNNILKHAEASEVDIQLMSYPDLISLTIEDNGCGFDKKAIEKDGQMFGLTGMENRAYALSGEFYIDSRPQKGTLISIQIPTSTTNPHESGQNPIG